MNIEHLRNDLSIKMKKGIPYILACSITWFITFILIVFDSFNNKFIHQLTTNSKYFTVLYLFLMLILTLIISFLLKAKLYVKDNPLSILLIFIFLSQFLYFPLILWNFNSINTVYSTITYLALINTAHLLPYAWVYKLKAYIVMPIIMSLIIYFLGNDKELLITFLLFLFFTLNTLAIWLNLTHDK